MVYYKIFFNSETVGPKILQKIYNYPAISLLFNDPRAIIYFYLLRVCEFLITSNQKKKLGAFGVL